MGYKKQSTRARLIHLPQSFIVEWCCCSYRCCCCSCCSWYCCCCCYRHTRQGLGGCGHRRRSFATIQVFTAEENAIPGRCYFVFLSRSRLALCRELARLCKTEGEDEAQNRSTERGKATTFLQLHLWGHMFTKSKNGSSKNVQNERRWRASMWVGT